MVCLHPFFLDKQNIQVSCGRCLACKIQRTHQWATRLSLEREQWQDAAFVTLTYAPVWQPSVLVKSDLQKFFKRLRRDLGKRPIKYFACGEYGDKSKLAHYHAIIFGLSPTLDRELIKENWPYCDWQALESTYRGRKSIGTVTYDSCRYVAGYVQKKLIGKQGLEKYMEQGLTPPFQLQSQGIGLGFAEENKEMLKRQGCIGIRGYTVAIPKYFRDKLGISSDDVFNARAQYMTSRQFNEEAKDIEFVKGNLDKLAFHRFAKTDWKNLEQKEKDLAAKMNLYSSSLEFDV